MYGGMCVYWYQPYFKASGMAEAAADTKHQYQNQG